MMLHRLATGATGVKQARYRRRPTLLGAARHSHAHAQYINTTLVRVMCVRAKPAAVECEPCI